MQDTTSRDVRNVVPPLTRVADVLTENLWLAPLLCVAVAIGLSVGLTAVDEHLGSDASGWYMFRGGPEGARSVLGAVASSIMTFTGVVFSVTVLVLQQASRQFSPRVLRTFLGDRRTQVALGVFVGTFLYALLTLRSVRGASRDIDSFVPSIAVWVAVVLAVGCVATFVYFIHHVSQEIRAVNVLARIAAETRASMETLYPAGAADEVETPPESGPAEKPSTVIVQRSRSGVVVAVAEKRIWELACAADVTIGLVPMVGDFVAHNSPLFEVWGEGERLDHEALAGTVAVARERTLRQDPAFGFRGIVDIAERALSPGINDPTTAVQALDQLHDLLMRLCTRRFPRPIRVDDRGRPRLILPRPDFDAYVRLSLDEIRWFGRNSIQIVRRLRFLLDDLLRVAPPHRRAELRRQLHALEAAVTQATQGHSDLGAMLHRPSRQGNGP